MKPIVITDEGRIIVGVKIRTSNAREADSETALIPSLWKRYFQIAENIPHKKNANIILGVYTDYESDYTGEYSLIVSSEVENAERVSGDLTAREIPAANYLVFTTEGEMRQALIEKWAQIWQYFSNNADYRRAYTADFEVHNTQESSKVDIYIAIK